MCNFSAERESALIEATDTHARTRTRTRTHTRTHTHTHTLGWQRVWGEVVLETESAAAAGRW